MSHYLLCLGEKGTSTAVNGTCYNAEVSIATGRGERGRLDLTRGVDVIRFDDYMI